ncbi:DUF1120 domain-containing protein [Serratia nevei]|uniref:DUF1120 domain-containing protein n=1 Tax=Serratia nevei TaxID=2703794 RepID=UPI003FA75A9A
MVKNLKKTTLLLAIFATTSTTAMAESIDVKVIGTITPAACKPTLTGGGVVDYGVIHPNTLKKDDYTYLNEKELEFSINCDAPAKLALKAQTARGASALDVNNGKLWSVAKATPIFGGKFDTHGLGLDNGKGIGGFGLRFAVNSTTADSNQVDNIIRDGNSSWSKSTDGSLVKAGGVERLYSWSKPGTTEPVAFTTLAGKLGIQAYLNKSSELDLTKPIKLDGLTTLELVYL